MASTTVKAPRQARSRETETRLLEALSDLLRREPWASITVEKIVEEADLSVGAFYKRFSARTDALALLVERTQSALDGASEGLSSCGGNLRARIDRLIDSMAEAWISSAHIIRAAAALQSSGGAPEALVKTSRGRMGKIASWLLERREEITHPNPDRGVGLALYFALQPLQTALLSDSHDGDDRRSALIEEAKRLMKAHLMGDNG